MGEVLNQIHQEMSELLDKQVNEQKEKTSEVQASSHEPKKCAMKKKQRNKKKRHTLKNVLMEGGHL